ncbi:MAG: hypothetical protein ACK4HF_02290 [Paracoccaceae bacterium]
MALSANSALRDFPENRGILRAMAEFFVMFRAAVEASNAVQNGRRPSAEALEKLGISADAFSGPAA